MSAADALAQVACASESSLILILSDINMPGMSGLEMLAESEGVATRSARHHDQRLRRSRDQASGDRGWGRRAADQADRLCNAERGNRPAAGRRYEMNAALVAKSVTAKAVRAEEPTSNSLNASGTVALGRSGFVRLPTHRSRSSCEATGRDAERFWKVGDRTLGVLSYMTEPHPGAVVRRVDGGWVEAIRRGWHCCAIARGPAASGTARARQAAALRPSPSPPPQAPRGGSRIPR